MTDVIEELKKIEELKPTEPVNLQLPIAQVPIAQVKLRRALSKLKPTDLEGVSKVLNNPSVHKVRSLNNLQLELVKSLAILAMISLQKGSTNEGSRTVGQPG